MDNQSSKLGASNSNLQTKIYADFESTEPIKDQWNNLVSESGFPNVFSHLGMDEYMVEMVGQGRELRLVVARDDSRIVGILPAWFGRIPIIPGLQVPGLSLIGDGGPVCPEYLGPIVCERGAIE